MPPLAASCSERPGRDFGALWEKEDRIESHNERRKKARKQERKQIEAEERKNAMEDLRGSLTADIKEFDFPQFQFGENFEIIWLVLKGRSFKEPVVALQMENKRFISAPLLFSPRMSKRREKKKEERKEGRRTMNEGRRGKGLHQ